MGMTGAMEMDKNRDGDIIEGMSRLRKVLGVLGLGLVALAALGKDEPVRGLVFKALGVSELKGVFLAGSSGEVLLQGEDWLKLFDAKGKELWKKDDLKFVTGVGLSRDGQVILYQTSAVPKKGLQITELDLTVHLADRSGKETLSQPNPYRYFTSQLSPTGNYIIFGDALAKKIYVHDRAMNKLWDRESYLWYVGFDPEEKFVYDSTSGLLLNLEGRRVWELPSGQRFLSMSASAEIVLSQPFLTLLQSQKQIYLTSRVSLEQVILDGYGAGVSYDGGLTAYEGLDRKVQVWRTRELIEKTQETGKGKALWSGELYLAQLLQFSRDGRTLFAYGETSQGSGKAFLVELEKSKTVWEKDWFEAPRKYRLAVSEDNRFLAVQTGPNTVEYYCLK